MDKNVIQVRYKHCPDIWKEYEGMTHENAAVAFAKKLYPMVERRPQTYEMETRWKGTESPVFKIDVVFDDEPSKVIMRR
jgi:hypothetical protein